jgi:spore maturation protein B
MKIVEGMGSLVIPLMLLLLPLHGLIRGVKVMDAFVRGAEEGLRLVLRMAPYMIAMFAALASLRASGLIELAVGLLSEPMSRLGLIPEVLTLAFLRPVSGSGALAVATDIMKTHGPDSFLGLMAGTMQGSTDTTFYVVAVYFGAVGMTRIRHTLLAGLIGDLAGLSAAVLLSNHLFK